MAKPGLNATYFWPATLLALLAILVTVTLTWKKDQSDTENWLSAWRQAPPLADARRALSAVASETHVYVIGGIDNNGHYVRDVEFAPILQDGNLGPWRKTTAINQGRFYVASVIVGKHIFLLGGGIGPIGDNNQPTNSVERALINEDGSLGAWESVSHMQLPRRGLKAIAVDNRIYAIGGYSGVFLKSTEYATVNADGSLSAWYLDPQESHLDRYIHSATYLNSRIYLLGGHVQNSEQISYGDVESASVSPLGPLSPWQIETSKLLTARFIASAFTLNNHIYILGGHNGGNRLKSVEFAKVFSNGRVGNWSVTSSLNTPRSAAATAVSGHYVYVIGGMGDNNALRSVEFARAAQSGQLGQFVKN